MLKCKSTYILSIFISFACHSAYAYNITTNNNSSNSEDVMVVTAAEQTRQALGSSVITQRH